MNSFFVVPLIMGFAVLTQSYVNKQAGNSLGLSTAVLINSLVLLVIAGVLYTAARLSPAAFAEYLRPAPGAWRWRYLLPGVCGFTVIMSAPWSMRNLGATKTFVLFVTAQVVGGILIDLYTRNEVGITKVAGAALVILGAFLVAW